MSDRQLKLVEKTVTYVLEIEGKLILSLFYHSRQRKIRNQAQGREERGQDQQD